MGLTARRSSEKQRKEDRTDIKQANTNLPVLAVVLVSVFYYYFSYRVVEEDLPRKTVSLVVALVSPTLLEATHSYMASSRGVRKG